MNEEKRGRKIIILSPRAESSRWPFDIQITFTVERDIQLHHKEFNPIVWFPNRARMVNTQQARRQEEGRNECYTKHENSPLET